MDSLRVFIGILADSLCLSVCHNWFLYRIFKTSSYIRSIQNGIFTVSEMLKSHNLLGFVPGPLPGC